MSDKSEEAYSVYCSLLLLQRLAASTEFFLKKRNSQIPLTASYHHHTIKKNTFDIPDKLPQSNSVCYSICINGSSVTMP